MTNAEDIDKRVKDLVELSSTELRKLQTDGVKTEKDMTFLRLEDYDSGSVPSIVKRRKLDLIGTYLRMDRNNTLKDGLTIEDIRDYISAADAAVPTSVINNTYTGAVTSSSSGGDSGGPKMYTDPLENFSGDPVDFEDWKIQTEATIRQTTYRKYLDGPADLTKPSEVARDQELYNMILSATRLGHAFSMVENVKADKAKGESGHYAWKTLNAWYLDPSQQSVMADHYTNKLEALYLDDDTTATEFINLFDSYVRKIERFDTKWSESKKIREFKKRIITDDYDVEKRTHKDGQSLQELITMIRNQEKNLELNQMQGKAELRRFKKKDDGSDEASNSSRDRGNGKSSASNGKREYNIPYIPGFLFRSLDKAAKKNVRKWRDMVNAGQTMAKDDLWAPSENDKETKTDKNNPPSTKGNQSIKDKKKIKKEKKKGSLRRVTTVEKSGLPDDTVNVKLDSDDEDYFLCLISFIVTWLLWIARRYDSWRTQQSGLEVFRIRMVKNNKREKKAQYSADSNPSVAMSRGRRSTKQPYAVVDSGAAEELIGGVGWHILHESKTRSKTLVGAVEGMGSVVLPKVDAVTAITDSKGTVHVVGFGNVTYDRRLTQYESLWNPHHLNAHGAVVDDKAKRDGGKQHMQLNIGGEITTFPFEFDGDIMTLKLREPTEEEIMNLGIIWIMPAMVHHTTQTIRRHKTGNGATSVSKDSEESSDNSDDSMSEDEETERENPTESEKEVKPDKKISLEDWKRFLGFPSDEVVEKTLQNTTQYCAEPVEMERRELPRQHRKKRLHPLHPRRLWGRSDSDTFFSSVKSIRKHTCVQLFLHVPSDYIFVRCMQREKHSHGAYQDFIREMGAPNVIVTDNSKTQTGEKWTKTSRRFVIKQRTFAPYNQNQNKAERRIQDVKNKMCLVMDEHNAPMEFWCYALMYVVDCLNHISKKRLGWKTSEEVLNGDTPDVSPFRFSFWQLVDYYEPKAKSPESKWQQGRFLGIAWESGDAFTFKIWIWEDKEKKKGRELTRNILRPSRKTEEEATEVDRSRFKFQKKVTTKKRRRGRKTVFRSKMVDLEDPDDEDTDAEEQVTDNTDGAGASAFKENPIEPEDVSGMVQEEEGDEDTSSTDTSTAKTDNTNTSETASNSTSTKEGGIDDADIEMINEINDQFSRPDEKMEIGGSKPIRIVAHEWRKGILELKILWSDETTTWESFHDMKLDHPRATAEYIVNNNCTRSSRGRDSNLQWAKKVMKDCDRAVRRITRLYDFYLNDDDTIRKVRRVASGGKKKKKFSSKPVFKYGVEVPRDAERALKIDEDNENHVWRDSMKKEVDDLLVLDCFSYERPGFDPGEGWQKTTLHMVFDIKHDLRRKSRLVAGGHLVDLIDTPYYSSTVKSISVQLLHVIAHKAGLKELCGDIGNAFPNAYTSEKVYVPKAGKEFGENAGKAIIIKKALYGLRSSAERFHTHLADSMRTFGFKQTRFDNDVWIRRREGKDHYEYVCTHVDDFMIVSDDPESVMKEIETVYLVKADSKGPPEYYLGNDYKKDSAGRWCIGCKKYLKEAILRVEEMFEKELKKKDTPMADGDHPEEDSTFPLNDDLHTKYQMLIGMLNWIVCLGRMDVAFATASLSRFTAAPRKGHLDRVFRVFGYLKKYSNRRYKVDSRDPILEGGVDELVKDYTKIFQEFYPDAAEEVDSKVPKPLIDELAITIFVDSDHAHDRVTRRSITGLVILVGRTPVFFMSKRQGAIETSTYGAEFCAMRTAVEEAQAIRYMLRSLGVKVRTATLICGDNKGVIQNSTISDSLLKKKHVAIAYHKTREAAAAGIVHPIKIDSKNNFADMLTKALTGKIFWRLYGRLTRDKIDT